MQPGDTEFSVYSCDFVDQDSHLSRRRSCRQSFVRFAKFSISRCDKCIGRFWTGVFAAIMHRGRPLQLNYLTVTVIFLPTDTAFMSRHVLLTNFHHCQRNPFSSSRSGSLNHGKHCMINEFNNDIQVRMQHVFALLSPRLIPLLCCAGFLSSRLSMTTPRYIAYCT